MSKRCSTSTQSILALRALAGWGANALSALASWPKLPVGSLVPEGEQPVVEDPEPGTWRQWERTDGTRQSAAVGDALAGELASDPEWREVEG